MEKNESFKEELETQYAILIKAKEKKEQQRFIILLIITIITMLFVLISVFFAFKAYSSTKDIKLENNTKIEKFYRTLSTTYNTGSSMNLSGIGNGYRLTTPKIIQITNEGNAEATFDIKLTNIQTSLLSTNNLVYTLTREGQTSINKELPLSDTSIVTDMKIQPNETITYTINVSFNGVTEANNYSNYYNSNIVIEQKDNSSSLLE